MIFIYLSILITVTEQINEPQREKSNNMDSDTNQAVQLPEMARGLKFCIKEIEVLYYPSSKNKGAEPRSWSASSFSHMQNVGFLTMWLNRLDTH